MAAEVPETRYARSGDVSIAYQVVDGGEGGHDYVCLPPSISNIEVLWESPEAARFMRRLTRLGRYVHYDKRGQGMSDRGRPTPDIDERVEDLLAVMDAAGVERGVVAGASEGAALAVMFAAAHPERVSHLVLYGGSPAMEQRPDFPLGFPTEVLDQFFDAWERRWATPRTISIPWGCPSMVDAGDAFIRWFNRYERLACSPGDYRRTLEWVRTIDIRSVLAAVQAPTLVLHGSNDLVAPLSHAEYLAAHIPSATLRELEGCDHIPWFGDQDKVLSAIEQFVLGEAAAPEPDRVLATVLFTDIVDSTRRASMSGDRVWRGVLDDHDHVVRREIEAAGGRLIKSTGDGALATFDRPGRAIAAAVSIRDAVSAHQLDIRAGIHTGEVELRGSDVGGVAVHLAARVCSAAGPGEIFVSRTVSDLVAGSALCFDDRGEHELKGVPGRWQLFVLES